VRERGKPIEVVRVGSFMVPIYATPSRKGGREYPGFTAYYKDANGTQRIYRASLDKLRAEVKARVEPFATGEADSLLLRGAGRAVYERATSLAAEMGTELDLAILELKKMKAKEKQVGATLEEALAYWHHHHDCSKYLTPSADVLQAFLAALEAGGNSREDLNDMRYRLGRFTKARPSPLVENTREDYRRYFRSMETGPRNRKNHRVAVKRFLNWARDEDYLPLDHPGMPLFKSRVKTPPKRVEVFDVNQRELMVSKARPAETPMVLIRLYVPMRTKEGGLLAWEDIDPETGMLNLYADSTKKRAARQVHLVPELLERLKPHWKPRGRIYSFKNFYRVGPRLASRAGLRWIRNGFRCSSISYLYAVVRDKGRVADEAGTSVRQLEKHYLKVVPTQLGRAWLGLKEYEHHPLEPVQVVERLYREEKQVVRDTDSPANVIALSIPARVDERHELLPLCP